MTFKLYLVAGICLMCVCAAGQTGKAFGFKSLDELWAYALKNNHTKMANSLNVQKAAIDYKTAESYLYPTASGSFAGQDNLVIAVTPIPGEIFNQPGKTIYAKFGKQFVYNTGVTFSRNFFDWQSAMQAAAARNNIALNQAQADAYDQALKQQTAQYYYTALIAEAAIVLGSQDLAAADSLVQLSKQRFGDGLVDASAVNLATINYNNVLQSNVQSQQLLDQSLFNLRLLAGLAPDAVIMLDEKIDLANVNNHMDGSALGIDKSLETYAWQITGAHINTKVQKGAYLPKLNVSAYLGKQQYRDDFGISFGNGTWNDYEYIGLNLNVPFFTGFATKNKVKSAEISEKVLTEQYKNAQLQSAVNDSIVMATLNQYITMCGASADNFRLYQNNVQLARQKYTEGLTALDVYLQSFEDYLKAENVHLNNLSSLYTQYAVVLSRR